MKKNICIITFLLFFFIILASGEVKISSDLESKLNTISDDEEIYVLGYLKNQVNLEELANTVKGLPKSEKREIVITTLIGCRPLSSVL